MHTLHKYVAVGLITLATAGCNQGPKKTDSMVRRDNANMQSQELVDKAWALTTPSTFETPAKHLDELIMIQNLVRDARKVYQEAKITGWDNPELTKLQSQLQSVNKPLALESLDALDIAIDKSMLFKQRKNDVESLPVSDNSVAKRALYAHLEKFNTDLENCCLDKILLINRFLRTEKEKYYGVIKLGHNTLHNMGMLIRDELEEEKLRNKIESLRNNVRKQESLTASRKEK